VDPVLVVDAAGSVLVFLETRHETLFLAAGVFGGVQ
jgi:hypothetical protein